MKANKRIIMMATLTLVALTLGTMLLTSCGKDNKDNEDLIGKWSNTAQSYEITIGGQEYLQEGCICMEFTDNKVLISDARKDCLAEWYRYTLSEKEGKRLLEIKGNSGCYAGQIFVVDKLTSDKLVLVPEHHNIDWDYSYIMKRP